jgi:uncharacterized protein YciI
VAFFAVTMVAGPGWDAGRPRREQPEWDAHAAFMDGLVADGFVVLGGPLADERVLLVLEAADESEIEAKLAADPWMPLGVLRIERIDRWNIWLDGRHR